MTQTSAAAETASAFLGVPRVLSGILLTVLLFAIVRGGAGRIVDFANRLIPPLSVIYALLSFTVIFRNTGMIPQICVEIVRDAFTPRAGIAGIAGYLMMPSLRLGTARGIFSNEAGLGSSPIMHGTAENTSPSVQGMWSVFEVFLDTIICCTLTALVLLTSKAENFSINKAFSVVFGSYSDIFIFISITLFAFCTIIGWYYCGETAFRFITNGKATKAYSIVFSAVTAFGAISALEAVWTLSDIFNGLMAFPNLLALILLSFRVKIHTRNKNRYFR
jgi:AGCS family alanine or glycine:cation symporter